jgi:hypothetical protein
MRQHLPSMQHDSSAEEENGLASRQQHADDSPTQYSAPATSHATFEGSGASLDKSGSAWPSLFAGGAQDGARTRSWLGGGWLYGSGSRGTAAREAPDGKVPDSFFSVFVCMMHSFGLGVPEEASDAVEIGRGFRMLFESSAFLVRA